ncbi:MAG: 1-acyl-sn-glycerol-3-phosphate acyltransferase [Candidatus Nealsonbacteria bacterium]|nr:1-acyl-sn-glycerol-3-phosphate acyltransferase [Candidatus Nealsonbacteria bacterium]
MRGKLKLLCLVWTIGLVGGLIFTALRITGRIKISGLSAKKLELDEGGLILAPNHPSLWEPAIMPFLFFPRYLFSLRFLPISVVDKANYYNSKWFSPFRFACLPVKRHEPREEIRAAEAMIALLKEGRPLILYPEAGRTFKGEEFKCSASGKRIRCFPRGLRKLFMESGATILPIWTKGGDRIILNELAHSRFPHFTLPRIWRVTTVRLGDRLKVNGVPRNEIVARLEEVLLNLGEQ